MVKSGLDHSNFEGPNDVPRVSQYRLAAHLSAAMVLYSVLFWTSLDVLVPAKRIELGQKILPAVKKIRGMTMGVKALVFLTAVSGAFVAGLVGRTLSLFFRL
jgi:heme a synthase